MDKITFKCGTRLLLTENILVSRTYGGVLEGRPDAAVNSRLIERFIRSVRQVIYNDAPHIIEPEIDESKGYPRLPEYACAVELTSFEPASDVKADMSHAVVVWFQSQNPLLEHGHIIELLGQLQWRDIATDGHW